MEGVRQLGGSWNQKQAIFRNIERIRAVSRGVKVEENFGALASKPPSGPLFA